MENEIMNLEAIEIMDDAMLGEAKPRIGTGGAMLIGAGLTLAVSAGVKLVKKAVAKHKANKELRQPHDEVFVDDEDVAEVTK